MISSAGAELRVGVCLSLSGRFARFGRPAAQALDIWSELDGHADVMVVDDESNPDVVEVALARIAEHCDVLLGPYSTHLMHRARRVAAENDWLLWNHGGSGDDVEAARPGHVVSVPTPTKRYALPFLRRLVRDGHVSRLWIVQGKGSFARQVAAGAKADAVQLGIDAVRVDREDLEPGRLEAPWDLFSVGTFEADVQLIRRARRLDPLPRTVCAVAAGVHSFADEIDDVDGVFGVGQWFPGTWPDPQLGPTEDELLSVYSSRFDSRPDYPAVQAVAAAVLATHCARQCGANDREALWSSATSLDTSTLFGEFQVDPVTGSQVKHAPVLVRWTPHGLTLA